MQRIARVEQLQRWVPAFVLLLVVVAFWSGLSDMERRWGQPEYSHGYLIPLLAAYLLLINADRLSRSGPAPSWAGVLVVAIGLSGLVVGELSALFIIVQYSFLITLWGLVISFVGFRGLRAIWASLLLLFFMVPLPYFFQFNLSSQLQFLSTDIGAFVLRSIGVPVYVEGNVIDMGVTKLQVVEACSGLRYLFPLMSMGFLCGYVFHGPVWARLLIFLSSVPITVVMNSVRIAITGILYDSYGIGAGDDFLHYFEGWVIFIACLVVLFGEMWLLARLGRRTLNEALDFELPGSREVRSLMASFRVGPPVIGAGAVLVAGLIASLGVAGREEVIPGHVRLQQFPLLVSNWSGKDGELSAEELNTLKLTDYALINYENRDGGAPVGLYVAYYDSQRKGASVHSPKACIPGGGWRIEDLSQVPLGSVLADGRDLLVNRAVITMGSNRVLIYYYFMQRGRYLTNEYLVKWYIFWDSITRRRTDGALVRLSMPIPDGTDIGEADARLSGFVRAIEPRLSYHIPGEDIMPPEAAGIALGAILSGQDSGG